MAGGMIAFTVAGQRMRLFRFDAFSYSTSLPCELNRPEDFLELVKMIALCVGPLDVIRLVWKPSLKTLPYLDWMDWSGLEIRNLCSRGELFGRRTSVWHLRDKSGKDAVVKASWLPPYLSHYEAAILEHLQSPMRHTVQAVRDACDIEQLLLDHPEYQDTYDRLPRHIGCRGQPVSRTKTVPKRAGHVDLEYLELAVLVTDGPVGRNLPETNRELSLTEILQVFLDIFKTYRVAAKCAVCYRDVNLGNIVWARTSTGVRGWLIDWGNAIIGGLHRKNNATVMEIVQACQDDAHSANEYFLCRAGIENRGPAETYASKLKAAQELPSVDTPGLSTAMQHQIQTAAKALKSAERRCRTLLRQRYIDDLESCIYTLVFVVLGNVRNPTAAEFLVNYNAKCRAWEDGFKDVFHGVGVAQAFKDLLFTLTGNVRAAQEELREMHETTPVGVAVTDVEDICTASCINLIEQSLHSMPASGFR